jgi:hypothetical protein
MSARLARQLLILFAGAMLVAGCGGDGESSQPSKSSSQASSDQVGSVLVLDGEPVGRQRAGDGDGVTRPATPKRKPRTRIARTAPWPALQLTASGTIDDGPDPFERSNVPVQPIPIEDDPYTTKDIDVAAAQLRRVDREKWDEWMTGMGRSPWQQGPDSTANALVEVTVERCGGARSVATGVVLADDTVVTTVHAVENAARRVRVSPAIGYGPRIPAMIQYLDVDDDVAVLRVPGLRITPMRWHVPLNAEPLFGYAFGVGPGGRSGALRRVPVITSMQESSITVEQPDGLAEQITDRWVQTIVGGITTGFSGGVVAATNDPALATSWGFHGLLRARVSLRSDTAGIVVPSRIVAEALDANDRLDPWYEHMPGGCPQWHR